MNITTSRPSSSDRLVKCLLVAAVLPLLLLFAQKAILLFLPGLGVGETVVVDHKCPTPKQISLTFATRPDIGQVLNAGCSNKHIGWAEKNYTMES